MHTRSCTLVLSSGSVTVLVTYGSGGVGMWDAWGVSVSDEQAMWMPAPMLQPGAGRKTWPPA